MADKRRRTRSKVDDLPLHIKDQVDAMLADTRNTYQEISEYLYEQGFLVSKSAIGRYALRVGRATQRLLEAQEQTKALIELIKKNPDADYTEGGLQIMAGELTKKLAQAQEEWDEMPLDKAARVMVALSRTKVYKDRVRQEMQKKIELAFAGMEADLMAAIKSDPQLAAELKAVLSKAKEKMMADD
ncbi:phage protein Gp27 family protein [Paenibacillus sp. oral taxon 786]|uniref:phage protein Gp27 family protein n=1 Tax=Paenibacillus sp. oral taxon 786 TaxID=652715 RepID=UPI000302D530|nr:phage protein Gp27 family protein [Paenibacillus sp. oral taxon 786]